MIDYLAKGGDVNAKDRNGSNALLQAAYYDQSRIVTYLLSKGAHIDVKNKDGRTPLMLSGKEVPVLDHDSNRMKSLDTMKILIKAGANLNARANDGQTAIVYSIWANREVMGGIGHAMGAVGLLLKAGADPNIKNNNGDSALVLANLYDMKYVVDELKKFGAK